MHTVIPVLCYLRPDIRSIFSRVPCIRSNTSLVSTVRCLAPIRLERTLESGPLRLDDLEVGSLRPSMLLLLCLSVLFLPDRTLFAFFPFFVDVDAEEDECLSVLSVTKTRLPPSLFQCSILSKSMDSFVPGKRRRSIGCFKVSRML